MQPRATITTDIVLLGAGHAHAEVLRQVAMRPMQGVRLTLIAREANTPYSGMLPGLIRGEYHHDDAHLDCARLAAAAGARLILDEALAIDPTARHIVFAQRPPIAYDLLAIDVGGQPAMSAPGTPVKPIGRFLARLAAIEASLMPDATLAVIGGGAGGVELAIALAVRLHGRARIMLVNADREPLANAPAIVRRAVARGLAAAGVTVHNNARATGFADNILLLSDGTAHAAMDVLWATGVVGPGFPAAAGIACDEAGCIRIDANLRSISHPTIFAAGDCAALEGAPRPKAGVWAVRAGAPLAENLRRAAAGLPLRRWTPQRGALAILGMANGEAVAWRGPFAVAGK